MIYDLLKPIIPEMKIIYVFLLVVTLYSFVPQEAYAHPGNTAADNCHYCRTNCSKWGVPYDERHCHGGGSVPAPVQEAPAATVAPIATPIPAPTIKPLPSAKPSIAPKPSIKPSVKPSPSLSPSPSITPEHTPDASASAIVNSSPDVLAVSTEAAPKGFWGWVFSWFK